MPADEALEFPSINILHKEMNEVIVVSWLHGDKGYEGSNVTTGNGSVLVGNCEICLHGSEERRKGKRPLRELEIHAAKRQD